MRAKTPIFDSLSAQAPFYGLSAAGESVGLPFGVMGNSEVGHTAIGAGRVVLQDYPQINRAIKDGTFFRAPALLEIIEHLKKNNSTLHVLGLCSNAGVHGHIDHIVGLIDFAKRSGLDRLAIHLITDGRDTPPRSGRVFVNRIEKAIKEHKVGRIATLVGRFWAMDRDKNWDRIKIAHQALTTQNGSAADPLAALNLAYQNGQNDENLKPVLLDQKLRIKSGDGLVFTNYRSDRAIQITKALVDPKFTGFDRSRLENFKMVTMTTYEDSNLPTLTAFTSSMLADPKTNPIDQPLGQIVDQAGLTQVRIAETEKAAHVTSFFDLGRAEPYSNRDQRVIIPSKKVDSFAKLPKMSAPEIALEAKKILAKPPNLLVINFANADMVGHTGDLKAAVEAIETLDRLVGELTTPIQAKGIDLLITADHGNAEAMLESDGRSPDKEHSTNPVPFIIVPADRRLDLKNASPLRSEKKHWLETRPIGLLADVAPTVLKRLGLSKSPHMTGLSFI